MEVAHSKNEIIVSQSKYELDLLKETGMLRCKLATTPMDTSQKLRSNESNPIDKRIYQRLAGNLIYVLHTGPDIAFSVSTVSQFMNDQQEVTYGSGL